MTPTCPVCHRGLCKHGVYVDALTSCPHCTEDEKVLEERIEYVAVAAAEMARAYAEFNSETPYSELSDHRDAFRDALRSLVREVRR